METEGLQLHKELSDEFEKQFQNTEQHYIF